MVYKYFFICVLLSSSLITSCAKKEELTLNSVDPISSLEGTWSVACSNQTSKTAVFTGTSFTVTEQIYMDTSCSTPAARMTRTGSFNFAITDVIDEVQFGDLDWTHTTLDVVVYDSSVVSNMNTASHCGFTNWAVGVTKSLLGATCSGVTYPSFGQVNYDAFAHILTDKPEYGLSAGDLMFGESDGTNDGSTPSKRPINFDATAPIKKQ